MVLFTIQLWPCIHITGSWVCQSLRVMELVRSLASSCNWDFASSDSHNSKWIDSGVCDAHPSTMAWWSISVVCDLLPPRKCAAPQYSQVRVSKLKRRWNQLRSSCKDLKQIHTYILPWFSRLQQQGCHQFTDDHVALENRLERFFGAEKAWTLSFNLDFDANAAFFSTIPQPGDVILYDEPLLLRNSYACFLEAESHEWPRICHADCRH